MKEIKINSNEIEFLEQSNAIEREYSTQALEDAMLAWNYAKKHFNKSIYRTTILKIHKLLLQNISPEIAGKIRTYDVRIGGVKGMNPELIEIELQKCIENYLECETEEEIKQSHIQFEKIHPFADGNGRTGRILMNLQRLIANHPILIIHKGEEQMEYYSWWKQ
ncbi:MAG: Fic family protein [Nanoarchaeota archaeon]